MGAIVLGCKLVQLVVSLVVYITIFALLYSSENPRLLLMYRIVIHDVIVYAITVEENPEVESRLKLSMSLYERRKVSLMYITTLALLWPMCKS